MSVYFFTLQTVAIDIELVIVALKSDVIHLACSYPEYSKKEKKDVFSYLLAYKA